MTSVAYTDIAQRSSFGYEELIRCAHGELFGPGNARLPLPPMLMFDRIVRIAREGGRHGAGEIVAELDVKPDLWFYKVHFENDPIMPGCLGLDALWQMLGFFLGWLKQPGPGRALSVGEVKFSGEVKPGGRVLRYHIEVKKVIRRAFTLAIADGRAELDGEPVYEARDLRVGLFPPATTAKAD
ncbi:MAG: bifunctional 3-hydroxydecanoyl-ACP dehydratase/trans-2-decenoyl-ACP isomerase [Alphaproteobacteria bacterium]|nr:bifunctional 3-hydroxydecanoyl-ACP dehydratase/trans-2-decenoyl-ACP isomerase [Alphaproteobacteria bacterium]